MPRQDLWAPCMQAHLVAIGSVPNEAQLCHVRAGAAVGAARHANHQVLIRLQARLQARRAMYTSLARRRGQRVSYCQ